MNEIDTKILSFFERAKEITKVIHGGENHYYGQDEAVMSWDNRINVVAQMIQNQEIYEASLLDSTCE